MNKTNIVMFSSGVTEKNGVLFYVRDQLNEMGYSCTYWKDLFRHAHDEDHIALLPMLIKKIPTFDYAVIICEGHDKTSMLRNGTYIEVNAMRDNVLFEIGLCSMALGLSKVILLTDGVLHLPEDLSGANGELAVKNFVYHLEDSETPGQFDATFGRIVKEIGEYIRNSENTLTPVVIGAASSLACGYVSNFVFRTLENIHREIETEDGRRTVCADNVHLHIVLPEEYREDTPMKAQELKKKYKVGKVEARDRQAEFRYVFRGEELHIYDWPTNIVTSYDTAKMILNIDADDEVDIQAITRFTAKELSLFQKTLNSLLNGVFLRQNAPLLYCGKSPEEKEAMLSQMQEIIEERVHIEIIDY